MDILSFILTRKPRNSNFLSISIREIHLTGKLKPSIWITNLVYKPYVVAQAYLKIQDRFSHYYTILAFLPHPLLNCLFLPREAAPVGFLNSDGREYSTIPTKPISNMISSCTVSIYTGQCQRATTQEECETLARQLGLTDTTAKVIATTSVPGGGSNRHRSTGRMQNQVM